MKTAKNKALHYWVCEEGNCPVFASPVETTHPVVCTVHNKAMERISAQQARGKA